MFIFGLVLVITAEGFVGPRHGERWSPSGSLNHPVNSADVILLPELPSWICLQVNWGLLKPHDKRVLFFPLHQTHHANAPVLTKATTHETIQPFLFSTDLSDITAGYLESVIGPLAMAAWASRVFGCARVLSHLCHLSESDSRPLFQLKGFRPGADLGRSGS